MLSRVSDVHGYGTRSARAGIHLATRDRGMVGYRVPTEWATLTDAQREVGSLAAFKRGSRAWFLAEYAAAACAGCYVCLEQRGLVEVQVGEELGEEGET